MDTNNFKKVFGNLLLNKKRENEQLKTTVAINNEANKNTSNIIAQQIPKSELNSLESNTNSSKKFVKFGEIIEKKIKETNKKEDILKKFDDLDENANQVIIKVAEMQKNKKKQLEELKKQESFIKGSRSAELDNEGKKDNADTDDKAANFSEDEGKMPQEDSSAVNLELNENKQPEAKDKKIELVYSSDSDSEDFDEAFSENITSIPKEFHIEICNKEWNIDVDPKKVIKIVVENGETNRKIRLHSLSSDYKCDQLYIWFHKMFQLWEIDLDEVSKEIMNNLFEVMVFCLDRDYVRAHDKYIELAIGNAPWPMGVTMVGIHERSGRSRIFKSQVAHILNDDNTKKYLQSVKRIMSLVQRLYPTNPSNSVFS